MATTYTGLTSTDPSSLGTSLVQTAYDKLVEKPLRAQVLFRPVVDKRPVQVDKPGSSVVFQIYNDIAEQTTPLTESDDVDSVSLPSTSSVTVTLREYGNVVTSTRLLNLFSLSDVEPEKADQIAFNQAGSIDTLVQTVLRGGTHVIREVSNAIKSDLIAAGASNTASVTSTDTLKSRDIRLGVAKLRANKVMPRKGSLFWCAIHPEVSLDLRAETGAGGWRTPQEYNSNDTLWNGEVGQYEGAFFVESPRCYNATDGATSARVYRGYMAGKQAVAEAVAEEFHTTVGPMVDRLNRFRHLGWYGVAGWSRYREAALIRLETSSSAAA